MKGYKSLKDAVMRDNKEFDCSINPDECKRENPKCDRYCSKFKWVIDRAHHYGEKLGLNWEDVLKSWEEDRSYWYMNYYQDCNQPEITSDKVRVFETVKELQESVGKEFRCPACGGVSSDPYTCDSGLEMSKGKICDWKVYGLFGDMGKGVFVYCKDKLKGHTIFKPVAWESK